MSSYLTSDFRAELTGALGNLFDSFSKSIVVHKEPKIVLNNQSSPSLMGYSQNSFGENIEGYVAENSGFYCNVWFSTSSPQFYVEDLNIKLDKDQILIKVDSVASDYIKTGKTEYIVFEDKKYNLESGPIPKNWFNLVYYFYVLRNTQ